MNPLAVSPPEAARMIGLSRSSLYLLFREGKVVPRKSGKRTLVLVEDLQRYLSELPPAEIAASR
jgi:hypothetical protein